ncbi:uncharacterized protein SCHCODRAFT_02561231 [Schizophyllum commune H4-8]|nr:uncharacterized protein SCHCODRAFT_02561231 [Schizophyllum commune H4-8]KAI5899687.1 hypothetical protein SCHCODRAFT_02561231 [Schizophyllum commune H4-8]
MFADHIFLKLDNAPSGTPHSQLDIVAGKEDGCFATRSKLVIVTMQFSIASLFAAAAVLFAGQAAAIASDPYKACNCPNNCDYNLGHECKFIKSVAINDYTISGTCAEDAYGRLYCQE